jgi:hypothetical protein
MRLQLGMKLMINCSLLALLELSPDISDISFQKSALLY